MGVDIQRVFTLVFAFGAALAGLSGVIAGPIQSAYPPMGASILVPALIVVVVGGLGSLRRLAGGQPDHWPGRDVREGVAARRLHADHLRGDGLRPPGPAPGPLRPSAQVTASMIARVVALVVLTAVVGAVPARRRQLSRQAPPGDPHLGHFRHEPGSPHGLCRHGVLRPLGRFFGIGAYTAALLLPNFPGLLAALVVPAAAAALGALVIGSFSIRVSGVYFINAHTRLLPDVLRGGLPERLSRRRGRPGRHSTPGRARDGASAAPAPSTPTCS